MIKTHDVDVLLEEFEARMNSQAEAFAVSLQNTVVHQADPALLDKVNVDLGGTGVSIRQVAKITHPETWKLSVTPFDVQNLKAVEKALVLNGFLVEDDDHRIFVTIESDYDEEAASKILEHCEATKIAIRELRHEAWNHLKRLKHEGIVGADDEFRAENELQRLTDVATDFVLEACRAKQDEFAKAAKA